MKTIEEMADNETIEFLDEIWEFYRDWTPWQLSELTHEEGSPWDKIWSDVKNRDSFGVVIPEGDIRDYYVARTKED